MGRTTSQKSLENRERIIRFLEDNPGLASDRIAGMIGEVSAGTVLIIGKAAGYQFQPKHGRGGGGVKDAVKRQAIREALADIPANTHPNPAQIAAQLGGSVSDMLVRKVCKEIGVAL